MNREVVIGASLDNTIRRQRDTSRVGAIKGGHKEVILIVTQWPGQVSEWKVKAAEVKIRTK